MTRSWTRLFPPDRLQLLPRVSGPDSTASAGGPWELKCCGTCKLASVVRDLETFEVFVNSKANTELDVDSQWKTIDITMDIVGFLMLFLLCTF